MRVLHLLASGGIGGIEILNRDYVKRSAHENTCVFVWHGGPVADEMKSAGCPVFEYNASKSDFFGPLNKLLALCREKQFQVLIVHHASPALSLYALRIRQQFPGMKLLIYSHENAPGMADVTGALRHILKKQLVRLGLLGADRVIAVSGFVKKSLESYFHIPSHQISVVYNGVDLSRFQPGDMIPHDPVRLIYVGRLIPLKGVSHTLRALAHLPDDCHWQFTVAGDGVDRPPLEALTRQLGLQDRVTFLGSRQDVPQLLAQSDLFIHVPDLKEGFGISVAEAMASGCLCLCSRSGSLPELIREGEEGVLIGDSSPEALSAVLEKTIRSISSDEVRAIRRRAVSRAAAFSIEAYASNLDCLIQCVADGQPLC